MNFDLTTLRTFTLIAQGRTFIEAADLIGRSQSAVTLQIQRLEQDLGTTLFRRSRHSVELTMAGERFLSFAQRLVQLNDEAALSMITETSRSISLGVTPDLAETILSQILRQFGREHPQTEVTLRVDGSRLLVDAVDRNEIDIAVALSLDDPLNQGALVNSQMLWIMHPDFSAADDHALPLALFDPPCVFRTAAVDALGANSPYRIAATSSSLGGIIAAVRSGLCVTARTKHLTGNGLVDAGGSLRLPSLGNVTFSFYARIGERNSRRDDLLEICRHCLQ